MSKVLRNFKNQPLLLAFCSFGMILIIYLLSTNPNPPQNRRHFEFDLVLWEYEKSCEQNNPNGRPECTGCKQKPELWHCVGEEREWGVVFVDQYPGDMRAPTAVRLAKNAELVVIHDSDSQHFPGEWKEALNTDTPVSAEGGRIFTEKSNVPPNYRWTSVIQGALDKTGEIFNRTVEKFNSEEWDHYYTKYNPTNNEFGTHIKLLASAALSTQGDILECGTGYFSTPVLHNIIKEGGGKRLLVSADTNLPWLYQFHNLTAPYHQLIGVPAYEDGVACGGGAVLAGDTVLPLEAMKLLGNMESRLTSNQDIHCPYPLYS